MTRVALTYAVADLHGRFDLLEKALDRIAEHACGRPYTVVTLGDYVDRGPDSRQVIERLMRGPDGPYSLVCLKGNHEDMMVDAMRTPGAAHLWISNGGSATLASYGAWVPVTHIDWIDALPLMHIDEHRVFVHAFIDADLPIDGQNQEHLLWRRYAKNDERGHGSRHVVHGHTPSSSGPLLFSGRTNLDTGAFVTGRLVVGVFDDARAGGPIDLIEVLA